VAKKLGVGIIGAGWPGQQHAYAIRANGHAELYGIAESDRERRIEFRETFSPRKAFSNYEELLRDPEIDAVIICLPNFLHFPATLAALEAGKHVRSTPSGSD
jgi:UDP-N-acetylglucosamine 3-dehydrogenase